MLHHRTLRLRSFMSKLKRKLLNKRFLPNRNQSSNKRPKSKLAIAKQRIKLSPKKKLCFLESSLKMMSLPSLKNPKLKKSRCLSKLKQQFHSQIIFKPHHNLLFQWTQLKTLNDLAVWMTLN